MNINSFLLLFSFLAFNTIQAQENDSIVYHFDTIIEYDEYREKDKKTYKRYYLINSKDSVKTRRVELYKENNFYVMWFSRFGFNVKTKFLTDSVHHAERFVVKKEMNLMIDSPLYTSKKSKNKYSKVFTHKNQFKFNSQDSTSKLKSKIFMKGKFYSKTIEEFDHTFSNYHISFFTSSFPVIISEDSRAETGVLTYSEHQDWNVNSKIKLKFLSLKKQNISIIIDKNARSYPIEWKPKEAPSEKTP
ncbi:MAG: hypothetical protein ACSHWW_08355 [Nonlabens sp.]|uniref:hypothetical protein n=1 Tax=Nonlabens sp. TaxID=1888209 RepID=UPI003EF372BB